MTTSTIRVQIKERDGEMLISSEGMALIFGMPLDTTEFPAAVMKRGKRRLREAFAAIGDDDMWEAMRYWGRQDHNVAVKFEYEAQL